MTKISKGSTIKIGLAITLAGALWNQAGVSKQVDFNAAAIMKMDAKLDQIGSKLGAIDVIRSQLDDLRKPIINTQFNVKRVMRRKFERTASGPVSLRSRDVGGACTIGPYSMNEYGN